MMPEGVVFARERPVDLRALLEPVSEAYALEMRHFDHPLRPDWDMYQKAVSAGIFHLYTVRDAAGELRGFSIMVVRPSSLFRARIANQDLLWLVPEFRGRSVGARFLGWCDEQLRQDGVEVIYRHTRLVKDFGGLLERMGYEEIDRSFGRRLT